MILYQKEIKSFKHPLALVCIFLTFEAPPGFPRGFGIFFAAGGSLFEESQALKIERFPAKSTFALQVPTNLEGVTTRCHRGTLQFYYPNCDATSEVLDQQVNKVKNDGLEQLFPGLSGRVNSYSFYDPTK